MKTIRTRSLAALFTVAAFLTPTFAATRELPLHGTLETVENNVIAFPLMQVNLEGVGHASVLGRFRMTLHATVNLITRSGVGTSEFIAADGSRILTTGSGQATPTADPEVVQIVEPVTIVSGTGRFAGATGSAVITRLRHIPSGVSTGTISGTILLPAGNSP